MSVRLKYRIVKVSSEDPEFPASEILVHSSQTKGWQSARFCEFPQELGLQFDCPVHLRQIQFLSHQSKIATKIELFTALPNKDGPSSTFGSVKFTRLGYLSLDSNERSQFQARELKSVYVDVTAQYLKILLHKCHINKYNLVNQVGLIALNVLGEPLGPDLAMGPPPTVPRGMNPVSPGASQGSGTGFAIEGDVQFDPQTSDRMRALVAAKKRAVELEDYDEAKRCKEMINRLRSVGHALAQLEEKKRLAVSNEDYDTAKALKSEVERLRKAVETTGDNLNIPGGSRAENGAGPSSSPPGTGEWGAGPPPRTNSPGVGGSGGYPAFDSQPAQASGAYGRQSPPSQRREPEGRGDPYHDDSPSERRGPSSPGVPGNAMDAGPDEFSQGRGGPRADGGSGGSRGRTPTPPGGGEDFPDGEHPLKSVPNYEQLQAPEALPVAASTDAAPLIKCFGEYIVRCLYSKTWNLREAALMKLELELNANAYEHENPRDLLAAFSAILKRTVPDKITQVFLTSQQLLLSLCQLLFQPLLKKADVQGALDPLLPLLVERLGDVNARCSSASRDALLALAHCTSVGPLFTAQFLLKPIKKDKKNVPSRVLVARLQMLRQLVTEFGVQPTRRDGIPLDSTMAIAMEWFANPAADVRNASVALVGCAYMSAGASKVDPFLKDLRPAQRDVFEIEFERLGADGYQNSARGAPSDRGVTSPAAKTDGGQNGDEENRPCQFCGQADFFTAATLDMHYWKDCPMLIQCAHCQQVVELMSMMEHRALECEAR